MKPTTRERLKRIFESPLMNLLVVALVFGALGIGVANSSKNQELLNCLREYNDENAKVQRDRALIADEDRKLTTALLELDRADKAALDDLVLSFSNAAGSVAQQKAAETKYLETVKTNNIRRAEITNQQAENARQRAEQIYPEHRRSRAREGNKPMGRTGW